MGVTHDMYACGRCGYGTVCRDFGRSRWAKKRSENALAKIECNGCGKWMVNGCVSVILIIWFTNEIYLHLLKVIQGRHVEANETRPLRTQGMYKVMMMYDENVTWDRDG